MSDRTFLVHAVRMWMLMPAFLMTGCGAHSFYNLATRQEETRLFSEARELKLGRKLAPRLEKRFHANYDPAFLEQLDSVAESLVEVADRRNLVYHFGVLEQDDVNAMALPGGYVYVFRGLLEAVESDDELAAVLAHEIGHITAQHSMKRLEASLGYTALRVLIAAQKQPERGHRDADRALGHLMLAYSREAELEADRLAVQYMREAGFDPEGAVQFLERLRQIYRDKPMRSLYLRTHPYIDDRIRVVKEEAYGVAEFGDYMNRSTEEFSFR